MNITISIIIPVHRDDILLSKLFQSLKTQTKHPGEIIIVLDNLTALEKNPDFPFPFRIIAGHPPGGPAAARNKGAAEAIGNYLFFLDSDVLLSPCIIELVYALIAKDQHTDAWIGSYDSEPEKKNFASHFKDLFNHFIHQHSPEQNLTFWGACGLINRRIFEQLGGFDEGFGRSSVEDIELGYRLNAAGFKLRLAKELQVKHLKRWTLGSLIRSDIFDRAIPWTYLLHRFGNTKRKDLNLQTNARISFLIVVLLIISGGSIFLYPAFGVVMVVACMGILVALNYKLYLFFYRKQGFFFVIKAILLHWFYYLYGGAAFLYATVRYYVGRNELKSKKWEDSLKSGS